MKKNKRFFISAIGLSMLLIHTPVVSEMKLTPKLGLEPLPEIRIDGPVCAFTESENEPFLFISRYPDFDAEGYVKVHGDLLKLKHESENPLKSDSENHIVRVFQSDEIMVILDMDTADREGGWSGDLIVKQGKKKRTYKVKGGCDG